MISLILTMIPSEGEQWGRDEIHPDLSRYGSNMLLTTI